MFDTPEKTKQQLKIMKSLFSSIIQKLINVEPRKKTGSGKTMQFIINTFVFVPQILKYEEF